MQKKKKKKKRKQAKQKNPQKTEKKQGPKKSLTTKDYNFFLGRIYFTSGDGSQTCLFINQHLIH